MRFLHVAILILMIISRLATAQHVVINEVMYAPAKPEPEWIELFNPADSAVSISGWTISNHLRTYSLPPDTISAKGYMVIVKDSVNFLKLKYNIPNAHILQTTVPSLVNTGDDIVFKDSLKNIIDSFKYLPSFGGGSGISLERRDYSTASDSENFGSCIDLLGGTPGAPNSILRKDFDLTIESLSYAPVNPYDLSLSVTIVNKGRKVISDGIISLASNTGLPVSQIQIVTPLQPLEKQTVDLNWQNADYGRTPVIAVINEPQDEWHANDTLRQVLYLPIPRNASIINEIMPTPPGTSSEWIELYNNSKNIVHMDSIILAIGRADTTYSFRLGSLIMLPKQYTVIAASTKFFSQFPSLNNKDGIITLGKSSFNLSDSGNQVMIINSDGSVIDSLHCYSNWYSPNASDHTGLSLERKLFESPSTDRANWNSSLDPRGSTPLEKNSYALDSLSTHPALNVQVSPNPFSPDGDGFNDETNITILIPGDDEEVISARLYDLQGRLRSTIALNQRAFRTASIRFEGKDDNGITLPIGLYTLVVESSGGAFSPQRKGIVIMKKIEVKVYPILSFNDYAS